MGEYLCFIEFHSKYNNQKQITTIKLENLAPKRKKQFRLSCTGENKYGYVYMKYCYKINQSKEVEIATKQRYQNVVENLETGGICCKEKYRGLVSGFDDNTDFKVLIC